MWMRNRTYCKGRLVAEILVQVLDPKSLNAMQLYDKVALSCGKELAWPVGDLQDDDDDRGISMKVETLDAEVGNTVSTVKVASVYFEHKSIDDVGSHWCFIHETTVFFDKPRFFCSDELELPFSECGTVDSAAVRNWTSPHSSTRTAFFSVERTRLCTKVHRCWREPQHIYTRRSAQTNGGPGASRILLRKQNKLIGKWALERSREFAQ